MIINYNKLTTTSLNLVCLPSIINHKTEVEEIAAILHLYRRYLRRRTKRYWVYPLLAVRSTKGLFASFYCELHQDDDEFFNYTRMSVIGFDELLAKTSPSIVGQDTSMRLCVGNEEKLLVTLRYLASGNTFVDLHHCCRLGVTTIKKIVKQVCIAIWNVLREECIPEPTKADWIRISQEFESRANVPNCLGAVDGKHIRIVKPANSASIYYNYKKYFSFVLMAITDANYKFVFIDVGSFGKCSDSTVFEQSVLYQKVQSGSLLLPEDRPISSLDPVPVPYVFLADDAFALSRRIMCPFVGQSLNDEKIIFNYGHCRGRRFVECTFGILANKWRIFHRLLNVDIEFAIEIVKACCILPNYVRDRDGVRLKDTLSRFPFTMKNTNHQDTDELCIKRQEVIYRVFHE